MDQKKTTHERIPQFKQLKSEEIRKLDMPGIKIAAIELSSSDDPVAITFEAADGRVLEITGYSSYETRIRVFTDKSPEFETTYLLTGELGPEVYHEETFKSRDDAEEKMQQLARDFQNARNLIINEKRVEV